MGRRFTANLHDVQVLKKRCEECESSLLKVSFNKNSTPLPGGETEYSGCILCDELLSGLIEMVSGRNRHISLVHRRGRGRGRGKGRGKGRGGKGRGKGTGKRSVFDDM